MGAPIIKQVFETIHHVSFPNQSEMASTMLRFQEYYESPKFRGLIFTRKEFEAWYAWRYGAFTYSTDWTGFNVPSVAFEPFLSKKFNDISDQEAALLEKVADLKQPFYLIATIEGSDPSILRHELAHGLYATKPDYKAEVHALLEGCQLAPIHRLLWSYHPGVWLDECHAYLLANYNFFRECEILKDDSLLETSIALNRSFDYYTECKFKR